MCGSLLHLASKLIFDPKWAGLGVNVHILGWRWAGVGVNVHILGWRWAGVGVNVHILGEGLVEVLMFTFLGEVGWCRC